MLINSSSQKTFFTGRFAKWELSVHVAYSPSTRSLSLCLLHCATLQAFQQADFFPPTAYFSFFSFSIIFSMRTRTNNFREPTCLHLSDSTLTSSNPNRWRRWTWQNGLTFEHSAGQGKGPKSICKTHSTIAKNQEQNVCGFRLFRVAEYSLVSGDKFGLCQTCNQLPNSCKIYTVKFIEKC